MIRVCPYCQTENTVAVCGECGRTFVVTDAHLQGRTRQFDDQPVRIADDSALPALCDRHTLSAAGIQGGEMINAAMRQNTCANCHRNFLVNRT